MTWRWRWWATGVVTATVLVAGCGGSGPAPTDGPTRVVSADNGQITVPERPQRVVATGYAVPALIEAGAPLVGISTWARGVPAMGPAERATYDGLTKVAGESAAETNYEQIAEVAPDLIVIGVPAPVLADVDVERLQAIAPVVAIGPTVPAAWRDISRRQADAAGVLAAYDTQKATYEQAAGALKQKYGAALAGQRFGHVGAYGQVASGTFQREFNGSWGTNVANDVGVDYYGAVKVRGAGSRAVSEYPSLEEIPASLGQATAISYSVNADGSVPTAVQRVLDSPLWQSLPAVQAGRTFAFRNTEAATYTAAMPTLTALDQALAPLLAQP